MVAASIKAESVVDWIVQKIQDAWSGDARFEALVAAMRIDVARYAKYAVEMVAKYRRAAGRPGIIDDLTGWDGIEAAMLQAGLLQEVEGKRVLQAPDSLLQEESSSRQLRVIQTVEAFPVQDEHPGDSEVFALMRPEPASGKQTAISKRQQTDATKPTIDQVCKAWNETARATGMRECLSISPKRRQSIASRLKDKFWVQNFRAALGELEQGRCRFAQGHNDREWIGNIDWFIRPGTVAKILEGQYRSPQSTREIVRDTLKEIQETGRCGIWGDVRQLLRDAQ